jgi:hypothetical protein
MEKLNPYITVFFDYRQPVFSNQELLRILQDFTKWGETLDRTRLLLYRTPCFSFIIVVEKTTLLLNEHAGGESYPMSLKYILGWFL